MPSARTMVGRSPPSAGKKEAACCRAVVWSMACHATAGAYANPDAGLRAGLAEPARALVARDGGHRLDRHVLLLHRPRLPPAGAEEPGGRGGGCRRRGLGDPRRGPFSGGERTPPPPHAGP